MLDFSLLYRSILFQVLRLSDSHAGFLITVYYGLIACFRYYDCPTIAMLDFWISHTTVHGHVGSILFQVLRLSGTTTDSHVGFLISVSTYLVSGTMTVQ